MLVLTFFLADSHATRDHLRDVVHTLPAYFCAHPDISCCLHQVEEYRHGTNHRGLISVAWESFAWPSHHLQTQRQGIYPTHHSKTEEGEDSDAFLCC